MALEQNPNGFRHLYGTTSLDAVAPRPVEWEELETEKTEQIEKPEEEDGEMEEGDGEEEAVDHFLEDVGYNDDEAEQEGDNPSARDPDFIPTPLMQQFKVIPLPFSTLSFSLSLPSHPPHLLLTTLQTEQQKTESKQRAVSATGLTSLMGYGSSDSE